MGIKQFFGNVKRGIDKTVDRYERGREQRELQNIERLKVKRMKIEAEAQRASVEKQELERISKAQQTIDKRDKLRKQTKASGFDSAMAKIDKIVPEPKAYFGSESSYFKKKEGEP